jgi:hypothetical protein
MRKPAANRPEPPALNLGSIACRLEELDLSGWMRELTKLRKLSTARGLGLHSKHPAVIDTASGVGVVPWPTVQLIEPHEHGYWISAERLPVLVVNLDPPSGVIVNEVQRVLGVARQHFGAPVVNPGPNPSRALFRTSTFKKWIRAQIVPFAYLLAWRATLDRRDMRRFPDHKLGGLLGFNDSKATSEAKAVLRGAISSIPALSAQIWRQNANEGSLPP